MRWPLRRQILLPMVVILLVTIGVVSASSAWLASRRVRLELEQRLAGIAQTLSESNFPLGPTVLRQLHGLTEAEFVVVANSGHASAASDPALAELAEGVTAAAERIDPHSVMDVAGRRLFHVVYELDRRAIGGELRTLHAFYPEAAWREARWQASWPPLAIGACSVVIVAVVISLVAHRITQPIYDLHAKVDQIAQGDFRSMPIPRRNDEVRDLVLAVNQMAVRLARYEDQVRSSERLRTLGVLGGGLAHQIRNAATGARMALDLHQRDCRLPSGNGQSDESLGVAIRQLTQIEIHLQRLLALGKPVQTVRTDCDLRETIAAAVELVRPLAAHQGIELQTAFPPTPVPAHADTTAITQMAVNLITNAVEAASQASSATAESKGNEKPVVEILAVQCGTEFELSVCDPGPGPTAALQSRLFEPLATDKPGGTGLGLAVARQIAFDHGGSIRWQRSANRTCFIVLLPIPKTEAN